MRFLAPCLAALTLFSFAATSPAQGPPVTTAPSSSGSELAQLREQVATLQAENEMLRAQLASISVAASGPAFLAPKSVVETDEKPLVGIEGVLQGMPKDEMPRRGDTDHGLRHTLMIKWVRDHAIGKTIALRGRFLDASGISGGHFVVRMNSGESTHPFESTIVMAEADASSVLNLHPGAPIRVTARIKNADVTRTSTGFFVVLLDLDNATVNPPF